MTTPRKSPRKMLAHKKKLTPRKGKNMNTWIINAMRLFCVSFRFPAIFCVCELVVLNWLDEILLYGWWLFLFELCEPVLFLAKWLMWTYLLNLCELVLLLNLCCYSIFFIIRAEVYHLEGKWAVAYVQKGSWMATDVSRRCAGSVEWGRGSLVFSRILNSGKTWMKLLKSLKSRKD